MYVRQELSLVSHEVATQSVFIKQALKQMTSDDAEVTVPDADGTASVF